jgi:hypothetical protein
MTTEPLDLVRAIMALEVGELNDQQTLMLFGQLIATGAAWSLQGSYGRMANQLIALDLITPDGKVCWDVAAEHGMEVPEGVGG